MTHAGTEYYCDKCKDGETLRDWKGVFLCPECLREFDNRSAFQLSLARATPYLSILTVWLLPGAMAVLIGRTTWDLTWSNTWGFAGIAVLLMVFVGGLGAATQAHFLGSDLWRGKSVGEKLQESQPFVFYAPWVLVSVLTAALILEHGPRPIE